MASSGSLPAIYPGNLIEWNSYTVSEHRQPSSTNVKVNHHRRFPSPGRCIYCATSAGQLTDEHIIPKGLGGTWILEKASCTECQKVTCDFEGVVLGHTLGNYRTKYGFSKSNRNAKEIKVEYQDRSGKSFYEDVPIKSAPVGVALPIYYPAKFFALGTADHALKGRFVARTSWSDDEEKRKGRYYLEVGHIKPDHFARMIAKIAHSYIFALWGPQVQYFLRDIIIKDKNYGGYIGSDITNEKDPYLLHKIRHKWRINGDTANAIVTIQLFACYGGPIYHAVVGIIPKWLLSPNDSPSKANQPDHGSH